MTPAWGDVVESIIVIVGYVAIITGLTAWFSPYICRVIAAALLTHADTTESARVRRRRNWALYADRLGIARQE